MFTSESRSSGPTQKSTRTPVLNRFLIIATEISRLGGAVHSLSMKVRGHPQSRLRIGDFWNASEQFNPNGTYRSSGCCFSVTNFGVNNNPIYMSKCSFLVLGGSLDTGSSCCKVDDWHLIQVPESSPCVVFSQLFCFKPFQISPFPTLPPKFSRLERKGLSPILTIWEMLTQER